MSEVVQNYRDKNYWIVENAQYAEPSFRLRKCARLVNELAKDRTCTLLDVGCGPAALRELLDPNITYYGLDIAIHNPASYLREVDFAQNRIAFDQERFDFVVGMGVFEYMGERQKLKLQEISELLTDDGIFIMSYINFGHFRGKVWPNYNNVQRIEEMTRGVEEVFKVERRFPASHHWRQKQPGRNSLRPLQMLVNVNIPMISPALAVEYFFVCSKRS